MATFRDVNGGDLDDAARRNDHKLAKWVTQNTVPTAGFRNGLINGDMSIFQRNANHTAAGLAFTMDRWHSYLPVAGRTIGRVLNPTGGSRYWMRVQRDSGNTATNAVAFGQTLETQDSMRFQGQYVTLSFRVIKYANWSTSGLTVKIFSGTGTDQPSRVGAAFTGDNTVATQTFTLASSGTYTLTGFVPANATQIAVYFDTGSFSGTAGAADCIDITDIQLEAGKVATVFERRPTGVELLLCQRYFRRLGGNVVYEVLVPSGFSANGTSGNAHLTLAPTMRIMPALSNWGTLQIVLANNTAYSITAMSRSAVSSSPNNVTLDWTTAGNAANLYGYIRTNNSLAGFLELSAEL